MASLKIKPVVSMSTVSSKPAVVESLSVVPGPRLQGRIAASASTDLTGPLRLVWASESTDETEEDDPELQQIIEGMRTDRDRQVASMFVQPAQPNRSDEQHCQWKPER